jgi:uncharacterized protein YdaU (DUF1376 family)
MSKVDVWMPLYIGDYMADTMRLTTLQHGAYLLLIMEYWRQGPLPNDEEGLASAAKLDLATWRKSVWPALSRFFTTAADGLLHQKRIDEERERALKLSETRSRAAKSKRGGGGNDGTGGAETTSKGQQTGDKKPGGGGSKAQQMQEQLPKQTNMQMPQQLQVLEQTHARDASPSQSPSKTSSQNSGPADRRAVDARAELWASGLPLIRQLVGKSESASRALLGRFLRQAADLRPAEPVAWITAALQNRAESKVKTAIDNQYAELENWARESGAIQ